MITVIEYFNNSIQNLGIYANFIIVTQKDGFP